MKLILFLFLARMKGNGKRPAKKGWEKACRAGTKTDYYFGEDASHIATYANIWQGKDH